jgi:hypothetical protein
LVYTPAVFVRVANKGDTGYGTWKRIRKTGTDGTIEEEEPESLPQRHRARREEAIGRE